MEGVRDVGREVIRNNDALLSLCNVVASLTLLLL